MMDDMCIWSQMSSVLIPMKCRGLIDIRQNGTEEVFEHLANQEKDICEYRYDMLRLLWNLKHGGITALEREVYLTNGQRNIAQSAEMVGYAKQGKFCGVFKQQIGSEKQKEMRVLAALYYIVTSLLLAGIVYHIGLLIFSNFCWNK